MHSSQRISLLATAALLGAFFIHAGCRKKAVPPPPRPMPGFGTDDPIPTARLRGARLSDIRSSTTWDFTPTRFTLANQGNPLPVSIAAAVLGSDTKATRIVGDWRLDEPAGVLILWNMERDGQKVDTTASVAIRPAGAVRANLGTDQYNIFPPDMVRRFDRESAAGQEQK